MDSSGLDSGSGTERDGESAPSCSSPTGDSGFKLVNRHGSVHRSLGGGKFADIILWRRKRYSFGVIIVATVAWFVFERSGLPFLSICSDVLLLLIVLLFIRANYAAFRDRQLEELPELELSEEMVNSAAASLRGKINYLLLMAHDITLGKDFKVFFQIVICLWLLSAIGSYFPFFTLAYIGTILFMILPALYSRYQECGTRYCGMVHQKLSNQYKIVDENVIRRIPLASTKDKDT